MLSPETLKPYLLDEDPHVRRIVTEYFSDGRFEDPAIVPLILDACDKYSIEANTLALAYARHLPVNQQALDRVLETLRRPCPPNASVHLNRLVANAPIGVLTARESEIRGHRNVEPWALGRLDHRRSAADWPASKLWRELQAFAERSESKHYAGEIDHAYVDALIEALGRHDTPADETLCERLGSAEVEGGWLEIFLIDLAGERRIRSAVPLLVDRYRVDTDYMLERCTEALAKIRDPEAARLVREAFPQESWNYKNYTTGMLSVLKLPQSEEAILALLETEKDIEFRTMLCHGLCQLFSERGVEIVRRQIRAGFAEYIVGLEEELLPVLHVLGIDLPEVDEWRSIRDERDQHQAERWAELEALTTEAVEKPRNRVVQPSSLAGFGSRWPESLSSFRRESTKIGRNDPCPCGSGKKYKKCCARTRR